MPSWDSVQYLKFADERTQPSRDLASKIIVTPQSVMDLGCGPGNSTHVLAQRWPAAAITGLDNSPDMIETAREAGPQIRWLVEDIQTWAEKSGDEFDVVFSNAALQWVPDHLALLPKLMQRATPGGAFAMQIPGNYEGQVHRAMRELAAAPSWRKWFPAGKAREWQAHDLDFYYDVLAPHATRLDLWATEYLHVLSNAQAIVEWYRGTGMRPYLQAIGEESERQRFMAEYLEKIRPSYPPQNDGHVLFPFRRIFAIAYH